ncbi:relaxase/mobilization nuclease domain-containing protein [Pontibacter liquoris]|uniref:relaxase/mobilization nuclease domain-containing protein n=1 Tax=Pontibacter liquoris TaxID=2905677 RepID=UPI001FA6C47C|nr:relaxase/mobilization nuclease domain-containing protein [Pontibacter liquoris]
MVAVIKTGTSVHRILAYNEQKVTAGVAACLLAANYPKDADCLTLLQKRNRLLRQAALNENVTRNSVHISLNFDPSEQLSPQQLREIAVAYMQRIGFGEQPYLVYQHHDAGHPHLHLVTVKVRADGSRIDMHNIGRNQSETARREIEAAFQLVRAADSHQRAARALTPVAAQKVRYGRSETKRAIALVLEAVLPHYYYTSLAELNAVLGLYGVQADRGSEDSRMYRHRGLTYRVLDEAGRQLGVPLKASAFYSKPTLAYLEARFHQNESARLPHRARLKNKLALALRQTPAPSLTGLIAALQKEGIHTALRQNGEGRLYGLTYIDHQTKCVFNGSALGKQYSAKGMLEQCRPAALPDPRWAGQPALHPQPGAYQAPRAWPLATDGPPATALPGPAGAGTLLDILLQPGQGGDYVPHQLKRNRKKKRRKRLSNP